MKRMCQWFGHKWVPVYVGLGGGKQFIGTYCQRCYFGKASLNKFVDNQLHEFATYNEEYFKEADQCKQAVLPEAARAPCSSDCV